MLKLDELIERDMTYLTTSAHSELKALAGQCVWFTGAAGFLGYYFCKAIRFWNDSHPPGERIRLLAIDNFLRGVPDWLEEVAPDEIELIEHDIIQPIPTHWRPANAIVHAASIASPMFYRKYPLQTVDANVGRLRRMLDYAVSRPRELRHMLFFSTSEIYGHPLPEEIPTAETFRGLVSCTGPRACYDESKRLGETLCTIYAQQFDVPVAMARPFNNYGPGLKLHDGRVLPDFARNALNGRDIVMFSDGSPTRTFCYITDALVGYLKVLVKGRAGEPYNIGIERDEISMRTLAEIVAEHARVLWGYSGSVVTQPSSEDAYLKDNPNRRCPDISKARTELEYSPQVDVREGVKRALNWYYVNSDR
jgi:dTDP-glucose 4,6-dehydratase/UDP-glucuronate decarboxylase